MGVNRQDWRMPALAGILLAAVVAGVLFRPGASPEEKTTPAPSAPALDASAAAVPGKTVRPKVPALPAPEPRAAVAGDGLVPVGRPQGPDFDGQRALMAAILNPADTDFAAKNDMLSRLASHASDKAAVQTFFTDLLSDRTQPPVLREYAVQYTPDLYDSLTGSMPGERERLLASLWTAARTAEDGIAGSALLALQRIGELHPGAVEGEKLQSSAFSVATNASYPDACRMGAFQAMALAGGTQEGAEAARIAALDEGASLPLRMAAMNAAVRLEPANEDFSGKLSRLAADANVPSRLRTAASLNLRKMAMAAQPDFK